MRPPPSHTSHEHVTQLLNLQTNAGADAGEDHCASVILLNEPLGVLTKLAESCDSRLVQP